MVAQTSWEHVVSGPQTQLQLILPQPQNKQNNMTMIRLCLFLCKNGLWGLAWSEESYTYTYLLSAGLWKVFWISVFNITHEKVHFLLSFYM